MKLSDMGIDPKTKIHDCRLAHAESVFLGILWIDHVGKDNKIPADALAILFIHDLNGINVRENLTSLRQLMRKTEANRRTLSLWGRDVRKMQNHLLDDHSNIPVYSKSGTDGGYWIGLPGEGAEFYDTFRKRGLTGIKKASRGKRADLIDTIQQLSFDFAIDDRTGFPASRRSGDDASMPVEVVDRFLEQMLKQPEKFSDDLRKLGQKFGGVLFPKVQAQAMKKKIEELNQLVAGL